MVVDRPSFNLGQVMTAAQRIVMRKQPINLSVQSRQILKIHEANSAAANLVFIGGGATTRGRRGAAPRPLPLARRLEPGGSSAQPQCVPCRTPEPARHVK